MSGYVLDMINSLKANSRRKDKHIAFDENKRKFKKGKPIHSKDLSPEDKVKLLAQLKANRKREGQLRTYKLMVSLCVTVVVLGIIVFTLKAVYF